MSGAAAAPLKIQPVFVTGRIGYVSSKSNSNHGSRCTTNNKIDPSRQNFIFYTIEKNLQILNGASSKFLKVAF